MRIDINDVQDVWMTQRGCGACFLLKAVQRASIGADRSGQDFDSNISTAAKVAGSIDFAPCTRSDGGDDFVGP